MSAACAWYLEELWANEHSLGRWPPNPTIYLDGRQEPAINTAALIESLRTGQRTKFFIWDCQEKGSFNAYIIQPGVALAFTIEGTLAELFGLDLHFTEI
jgi:hypothetical protein